MGHASSCRRGCRSWSMRRLAGGVVDLGACVVLPAGAPVHRIEDSARAQTSGFALVAGQVRARVGGPPRPRVALPKLRAGGILAPVTARLESSTVPDSTRGPWVLSTMALVGAPRASTTPNHRSPFECTGQIEATAHPRHPITSLPSDASHRSEPPDLEFPFGRIGQVPRSNERRSCRIRFRARAVLGARPEALAVLRPERAPALQRARNHLFEHARKRILCEQAPLAGKTPPAPRSATPRSKNRPSLQAPQDEGASS